MTIRATLLRRWAAAAIALAVAVPIAALDATPALAAESCQGGQSGVFDATCNRGGGGTDVGPLTPGVTSHIIEDYDQTRSCVNRVGQPSYLALMYGTWGPSPSDPIAWEAMLWCVVVYGDGAGGDLVAQAKVSIPAPVMEIDFKQDFLTGAPIKFAMTEPGTRRARVPGFAAWVEARPTGYEWDFGDGTTSTDPAPTHVYETKSPDEANPDNHTVTVRLRVMYQGYLHLDNPDINSATPPEDLGTLSVEAEEQRTIVEVWSALTERK